MRESPSPGSTVTVQYYFKGALHTASNVTDGVVVAYTTAGFAASEYGLKPGMVLVSINDTNVSNLEVLSAAMNLTRADNLVNATVMSYDESAGRFVINGSVAEILLSDKHAYYAKYYPGENKEEYRGMGYLGAGFLPMGVSSRDAGYYSGVLANPFAGDRSLHDFSMSWLRLIALPFLDLAPIRSPVSDLYHPSGSLAWMPDTMFWLLANSFYWIFWLNLMVGLTNVLPAVPLDGGYLFRDALDYIVSRIKGDYTKEKRENVVGSLTLMVALAILFLIVWQLVGPAI
jgi:membrane-associated protease RseP (regulator of RpoE activity)